MFQINIVIGILLAYLSNFLLARQGLGATEWRWQFGVAALPPALFLVLVFGIPHNPRWLGTQKRVDQARAAPQAIGTDDPEQELQRMVNSIQLGTLHKN